MFNKARKNCPGSHEIWIAAAQLEEANNDHTLVNTIVKRAVEVLVAADVNIKREQWIKEAMDAEDNKYVTTCQAIVRNTIALGVEDDDRKKTWVDDANSAIQSRHFETARAIFAHALSVFPTKKSLWLEAAFLERDHGTPSSLESLLKKAVERCPKEETLWLMGAKEKWLAVRC